jgi:hypothetical protein
MAARWLTASRSYLVAMRFQFLSRPNMRAPMARICEGLLGALELQAELEAEALLLRSGPL